jgi:hypothetical protein
MKETLAPTAYELRFDSGEEIIKDSLAEQQSEIGMAMIVKLCRDFGKQLVADGLDRNARIAREQESGVVTNNDYFYISKIYEAYVQNFQNQEKDPLLFLEWFERQRLQETDFLAWLADEEISDDMDFNSTHPVELALPNPIKFDGWMNLIWTPIDLFYIPEEFSPLECRHIYNIDYIYNDKKWPIMSGNMLRDLKEVGDFQHRCYPIEVTDFTLAHASKTARSGRSFIGYQIVQTLENLDIFDWEKSQYIKQESSDNCIQSAEKVILKKTDQALPPLFRISAYPSKLFVSAIAKEKITENRYYRGLRFTPVDEEYKIY